MLPNNNTMSINAPPITLVKIRANFIDDEGSDCSDNKRKNTSATITKETDSTLEKINSLVSQKLDHILAKYKEIVNKHLESYVANVRLDRGYKRPEVLRILSEHGLWVETSLESIIEYVRSAVSLAFNSELQGIQSKLKTHFAANRVHDSCFQLLDQLAVEHANKFKQIISNYAIKTNILAAIGRKTAEANQDQRIDKDVFVADKVLYRIKSNCNIEPVISSEHRRCFEINSMRGTIPKIFKPNPNEHMRLIANALFCNRRPQQDMIMWVIGENTQSFASNLQTIAGGYAMYVSKTDTKVKTNSGTRVAIIENSRTLLTKLNKIPSAAFPLVVSASNDFTPPECGHDWLVLKFSPPAGATPESLFLDLLQAANPSVIEPISSYFTSNQLANESLESIVKDFAVEKKWMKQPTHPTDQKKTIAIKDVKNELAILAAKQGIKVLTQKTIAQAFLNNEFSVTNPRNVLSIAYFEHAKI
jgi:hypothetical protein